jgi:hypothetical protein
MLPLATLALVASSPGQTFGVSIFNEPMRESLSLSHSQFAAAYMLGTAGLAKDWFGSFDAAMIAFVAMPIPIALLSLAVAVPREYAAIRAALASADGD